MPITQNVYTLSSTVPTRVVAPTVDAGHYILKSLEPGNAPENYARQGRVYDVSSSFTVTRSTSVSLMVTTGPTGMQFQYYQIVSTASNIRAELIEGATITGNGVTVPSHNVNRNFADDADAVFQGVTSFTGGTIVNAEFVTADKAGGGDHSYTKVITLEPDTDYVFRFTETTGNADPAVFLQIGFAELYNGYTDIWLGTKEQSFVLHGHEEISHYLQPYETINAIAGHDGAQIAVLRQD